MLMHVFPSQPSSCASEGSDDTANCSIPSACSLDAFHAVSPAGMAISPGSEDSCCFDSLHQGTDFLDMVYGLESLDDLDFIFSP